MCRRNLGKNVNRLRGRQDYTQEELAAHSGIDRRQIQRIEAGKANPGVEMLDRLRRALACDWNELLGDGNQGGVH